MPARFRTARPRFTSRCGLSGSVPAMKSSPSAIPSSPPRTPSATAARVPVFVDIEADGFNIDPALIEPAITARTKAILCVHQLGMPCDLSRIVEIGKRHSIPVIEDAACATGSEILWNGRWEKIGKPHGDIACFSFHPRKVVTTGDGGMLTTANPEYDAKFRLWRQHGMSVTDAVRHGSKQVIFESYPEVGYNYRMTDMQAALGREQLMRLDGIVESRRRLAAAYTDRLGRIPGLKTPAEPQWARSNWQSYCVGLPHGSRPAGDHAGAARPRAFRPGAVS